MPVVEFGDLALLDPPDVGGTDCGVFDKRASLKDRASRILLRLEDGRELRLREFGTKQRAWAKLLPSDAVNDDEAVARLGPGSLAAAAAGRVRRADRPAAPPPPTAPPPGRHLRHRPLLGRRDPLGGAALALQEGLRTGSRRRSSSSTTPCTCSATRSSTTSKTIPEQLPDKVPMPLQVHKREGSPCPRCGTTIEAVFFSEHQTNYCPTGADRRSRAQGPPPSRLLK